MKIKLIDLGHTFQSNIKEKFDALKNINMEVNDREFIGIVGPTGSGKTTLIEHFNGLLIPTSGQIEIDYKHKTINKKTNQEIEEDKKLILKKSWRKEKRIDEIRKKIGIVFQFAEYQLFEETIEKDIIFGPINMGVDKNVAKEIAKEMIIKVGLDESFLNKSPFELSGGQKRRVAIAGILSIKPDILIFDEPTAGLDPEGVEEMLNLFKKLNEEGNTIIIVTHDLDNVLQYTTRTIFLKEGQVIKDGETLSILSDENLLRNNKMSVPKLITLINKINKRYSLNLPYVRTIDQFVNMINEIKKGNK